MNQNTVKKIVTLGMVMLFSLMVLMGCVNENDPNRGYIRGIDRGKFIAHIDSGIRFGGHDEEYALKLISSRNELVEWVKNVTQEMDLPLIDSIFEQYDYVFFEEHQLIFICFWGSVLKYKPKRIKYNDNILFIEFVSMTTDFVHDVGVMRNAILEIIRISDNLSLRFYLYTR